MPKEKVIELRPIKESTEDYEAIEKKIRMLLRRELYVPLMRELLMPDNAITQNAAPGEYDAIISAIRSGRITFSRGNFYGLFSAQVSKALKSLGAVFDRKTSNFKITIRSLPIEVRAAVESSEHRFADKLQKIDAHLGKIFPENISDKLKVTGNFETAIGKVDADFQRSVKGITIAPTLTSDTKKRIADEWSENMKLWVKDFTEKEIIQLRKDVQKAVLAGNRPESMVKSIQKSYGVSVNKAKFLARQETSLLMTKLKQDRYEAAGVNEYKWGKVAGSPNHPVRPAHKALAEASDRGKIYRWDDPPISTAPGEPVRRNNPGQDYNCRCFAKPVVRFRTK